MGFVIRLEGVEEFAAQLRAVKDFDPAPALQRAAERMESEVRSQDPFPYQTGDLKASGRSEGGNLYWDDLDYAAPVEARTGFFTPIVVDRMPEIVEEELKAALDEAVGDAGG